MNPRIGVIGGSGLYALFKKDEVSYEQVKTPFGEPSDEFGIGKINETEVVFLPRHGKTHRLLPGEINYLANIYGMKMLGVNKILSISAVGSLREEYHPRDVVIVDQFFDRTNKRPQSFFGNGVVAHVAFGDPVCPVLHRKIIETTKQLSGRFHYKGTYVNMEGPQFSTRAESNFYRKMGFDVIGMTNLSEARLAREAEICYSSLAFVTDYDCWHEEEAEVSTDQIIAVLKDNAENAKKIIHSVLKDMGKSVFEGCPCQNSLKTGLMTPVSSFSEENKTRLHEIVKKYL